MHPTRLGSSNITGGRWVATPKLKLVPKKRKRTAKLRWRKWVPILTAEDFRGTSLTEWRYKVFGSGASADGVAYQYIMAECWIARANKGMILGVQWEGMFVAEEMARIWNRAMKRLGYTENYDA